MGENQLLFLINGGCSGSQSEMEVDDLNLNAWNW